MRRLEPQIRRNCEGRPGTRQGPGLGHPVTDDLLLGAKEVQDALCAPASQRIGSFDIACARLPARHISGDFVATFEQGGSWFLTLGNLMGKGLPAAMWLTHMLDLMRRSCETSHALPAIMQFLNREMHFSRVGVPLTSVFLARLDPAASSVTYSCGGCPPAFLLNDGKTVTMLESGGPILGAIGEASYQSATIELGRHDTLLVVSNGVIEKHQHTGYELRQERVAHHLRLTAGESAAWIVQSLLAQVSATSPTIGDDLSLMAVQRVV